MTLPNWGQYVAGEDTLQYYYQIQQDTVTQEALFAQKVSAPTAQSEFLADVLETITSANLTGVTTSGGANTVATRDGVANIPNSLPGGYTP